MASSSLHAAKGSAGGRFQGAALEKRLGFVESLDLAEGKPLGDDKASAAVDAGSTVTFTAGVSDQHKQDVLNSCLLAQLAASKKFDRENDTQNWYGFYRTVLESVGWVITEFKFDKYSASGLDFTVSDVIINVLKAIASGNEMAALNATIDALKALDNGSKALTLFSNNSVNLSKGNFQFSAVSETSTSQTLSLVSMKIGAFYFSTSSNVTNIFWFRFGSASTDFYSGAENITLDEEVYAHVRQTVIKKLGDKAQTFVQDLDI